MTISMLNPFCQNILSKSISDLRGHLFYYKTLFLSVYIYILTFFKINKKIDIYITFS